MKQPIDLRPDHASIVHDIIARHLPGGVSVRVFGSRAKWSAKPHSDLDLALKGKGPLPRAVLGDLAEAFSESDLPFRVDVVDWHSVAPSFQAVIDRDGKALPWPVFPLRQFVDPNRAICYGIVQPGKPVEHGVPILRVNNFGSGGLNTADVLRVDKEIEAQYIRSRLQGGELLITLVGSVGQSAIAPEALRGWNVARAVGVVPVKDQMLARWVKLVFTSSQAQQFFAQRANTTVQTTVNLRDLAELPVPMPPQPTLESIVAVLAALDDKIELNRRMNETLEGQAQAIFRDWFVDFGPVRRAQAGEADPVAIMGGLTPDPARAAHLAALFPAAFGDDGLPVGWSLSTLGDTFDVKIGRTPPRKEAQHFTPPGVGVSWMSIRDMGACGTYIAKTAEGLTEKAVARYRVPLIADKTVVVSFKLTVGRVAITSGDMTSNEAIAQLQSKAVSPSTWFTYCWMIQFDYSTLGSTSSIATAVNSESIKGIPIPIVPNEVLSAFDQIVEPLFQRIKSSAMESATLAETRDYLLPRLMSGAVRVAAMQEAA